VGGGLWAVCCGQWAVSGEQYRSTYRFEQTLQMNAITNLMMTDTLATAMTTHCALPTAHCSLLTAYRSLPTAHCPLPTVHRSLLTKS